jgi:hypothetical protein
MELPPPPPRWTDILVQLFGVAIFAALVALMIYGLMG